jgi:PhnB protein
MIGVSPYIAFRGDCSEAIDFYKQAVDAELLYAQKYSESPMAEMAPNDGIMHATLKIGGSHLMVCDDFHTEGLAPGGNISLAIGLDDVDKAHKIFDNLADGGKITMPLDKTFWAEAFGMVTDKYGVNWMINCETAAKDKDTASL